MSDLSAEMTDLIEKLRLALRAKEGVGGGDLKSALRKARHRLPRRVRKQAQKLVQAAPLAGHPKLCLTLDHADLRKAGTEVLRYLETVDLADRRKGWWLGMLGAMAFNILALIALVIAVLIWRGLI